MSTYFLYTTLEIRHSGSQAAWLLRRAKVMIHIAQRSEQTHERTVQTRRASASGDKIPLPEEIGCGNHRGAHRLIFVRPLRPDAIAINPQCEAH